MRDRPGSVDSLPGDLRHGGPSTPRQAVFLDGPIDIRSVSLAGLFLLAIFYTLNFARPFFLPVFLALHLSFLFSPVVRGLRRMHIPATIGAAVVLLALLGATGYGFYRLSEPAAEWMEKLPESLRRLETKVRDIRKPVEKVRQAAEQVEKIARLDDGKKTTVVEVKRTDVLDGLLKGTRSFLAEGLVMVLLLYFLLASEDLFLRKLVKVLPGFAEKKTAVEIVRTTENHISAYLLTVTLINLCLGAVVAVFLWVWGMPNPTLWGVMVALLNFIPFVGPLVGVTVLGLVAVLTFADSGWALVPPAVYFGLHLIETNLITPLILGHRFTLNPVVIFLWLSFWFWIWGIPGGLLAVPMLATLKIFCDNIEPLTPIGELLGR